MMERWIYQQSDGRFLYGGAYDAPPPDWLNHGVAGFAAADRPDITLHRFDPATGGKRLATAQEIADARDADVLKQAEATSRQKDIATSIVLMVRYKNVAAWNAMSNADKKTAVLAQCDEWKLLRALVEKLL